MGLRRRYRGARGLVLAVLTLSMWAAASVAPAAAATPPALPAGCGGGALASSTYSNGTPVAIPDNNPAGIISTIVVTGATGGIRDLDVLTNITHTFPGDVDMTLTSPTGTVVTLSTDNGGTADNAFAGTVWDDQADPGSQIPYGALSPNLANDHVYAVSVLATPLVPDEPLVAFEGENPNGTWTLKVVDDAGGDTGALNAWELHLQTGAALPQTAPFTAASTTPVPLPDNLPAGIVSTVSVAGARTYMTGLTVVTDITHTFPGDIDATLTSPAGRVVTLTTDNGGTNDNAFSGTTWSDQADPGSQIPYVAVPSPNIVGDHTYAILTPVPSLTPEEGFSALAGQNPNGTWTLKLVDDAGGDTGTLNSWSLAGLAACPGVNLRARNASVREGNRGTKVVSVRVVLSAPVAETVTVHYATANGTAKVRKDYRRKTGLLTFLPGQLAKTVKLRIVGDLRHERRERFTLRLSNPVGATIAQARGTVTIRDND